MRVLVTADAIGGVWTYTRELVIGLTRRGHDVVLVSFGRLPSSEQVAWMRHCKGTVDFRPTSYRLEWMQECEADVKASSELLRSIIDETKPDILHSNQFCFGSLACEIPRLVVAHSDVASWCRAVRGSEPEPTPWFRHYKQLVTQGVTEADLVVGITESALRDVSGCYGKPKRSRVIYNGRDDSVYVPGIKENLVVSAGRVWDEAKQVRLLTEVSCSMAILVAGEAQHPESGDAPSFNRGGVQFLGGVSEEEMRALFARAGVYVATSRYEPFGLAAVEAALSGCAIVANDIPSLREVWGQAAVYFATNCARSLEEQLNKMSDAETRRHWAEKARLHARARYGAQCMVDEYLSSYAGLLRARGRAA